VQRRAADISEAFDYVDIMEKQRPSFSSVKARDTRRKELVTPNWLKYLENFKPE